MTRVFNPHPGGDTTRGGNKPDCYLKRVPNVCFETPNTGFTKAKCGFH